MKNRGRFVGLRPQDVKVYPCSVLVENGRPAERAINITTATEISRENRKQAKEIVQARSRARKSELHSQSHRIEKKGASSLRRP